ncbi:MAG: hypothetical protein PHR68_00875 [Candidatus Gracilibacteria bacterium]|nr:hypothetical protein [Candidatus Gracilibacteria bacterium]
MEAYNDKLDIENIKSKLNGNYKTIIDKNFKDEYPRFGNLSDFIKNPSLSDFQKRVLNGFLKNEIKNIEELNKKAENPNINDNEILELLKMANSKYLTIENLRKISQDRIKNTKEKITKIDKIYINSNKIDIFFSGDDFLDKENLLNTYIEVIISLNKDEKKSLDNYINNKGNFDKIGLDTLSKFAKIISLFNLDSSDLIPAETKRKLNELANESINKGYLSLPDIYVGNKVNGAIIGLKNKTSSIEQLNSDNNSFEISDKMYKSYPGLEKLNGFLEKNYEKLNSLIGKDKLDNNEIASYEQINKDFIDLCSNIKKEKGYIPFEYLQVQQNLTNIKSFVLSKNPSEKTQIEHSQKMERFLYMFENYISVKGKSQSDKDEIRKIINDVKFGKVKNFTEIKSSRVVSLIEDFFEDLTDAMKDFHKDSNGNNLEMTELHKENKDFDDTAFEFLGIDFAFSDVSMKNLDLFIDKFHFDKNTQSYNFNRLESAVASNFVGNWLASNNNKSISRNIMHSEIQKFANKAGGDGYIEKELNTNKDKIKDLKDQIKINSEDYLKEIQKIPKATQEILLKSRGISFNPGESIERKVLDVIIDDAKTNSAILAFEQEAVKKLLGAKGFENDDTKKFLDKYFDKFNDIKELAGSIAKELVVVGIATIITGGVGGYIMTGTRLGQYAYMATNIAKTGGNLGKIARFGTGVASIATDSAAYTGVSAAFYEGDQFNFENFAHNFAMFGGGIVGAKIAGKLVSAESGYKQLIAQGAGGTIGATATNVVFMFQDGSEVNIEEMKNMLIQGSVMGALMIPAMKGGHTSGNYLGQKFGNSKFNQDVLLGRNGLNRDISKLEAQTTGKKEFYDEIGKENLANLKGVQDTNNYINFGSTEKKISTLLEKKKEFERLNDEYFKQGEILLNGFKNELTEARGNKSKDEIKQLEEKYAKLKEVISNDKIKRIDLRTKLNEYMDNGVVSEAKIKSIPEAHPIDRLSGEIKYFTESQKLGIKEYFNDQKLAKIEKIKTFQDRLGSEYIGSGYYIKGGNEILNSNGVKILSLPEGSIFTSLQYVNIGNKRLPLIEIKNSSGESKKIRIYEIEGVTEKGLPEAINNKLINSESEIIGLYDSSNKIIGYKIKEEFYDINGKLSEESSKLKYETEKTISNSGRVSKSELIGAGVKIEEQKRLKKSWDSKIDSILTNDIITNMQKKAKETINEIKNDSNIPAIDKTKIISGLEKFASLPIKTVKWILNKGLWTLALTGGGILGLDYANDGDIDLTADLAFISTLLATDTDILNKVGDIIPGGKYVMGPVTEWMAKYPKTTWLLRFGGAFAALNHFDTK